MIALLEVGDVRDGLRRFAAEGLRVQTCVTSPPYRGLRDYGVAGQIGLEPTIAEYVANMVDVFRLVRDILAEDGTLWLNLGDCYAASGRGGDTGASGLQGSAVSQDQSKLAGSFRRDRVEVGQVKHRAADFLKPKDLCGIPWRVAFALQADGWYLRSDIVWHKPNPMPESVTDRPTKAHEYLFLLTKSERYYYDGDAIREPASDGTHKRLAQNVEAQVGSTRANGGAKTNGNVKAVQRKRPSGWNDGPGDHRDLTGRYPRVKDNDSFDSALAVMPIDRNKRTVWTIPTQSFSGAHFATFPTALVEPCVLAGSRAGDLVLDPFMGSGTVAQVAQDLGRGWLGCELNPEYARMIEQRTAQQGMALA